MYQSGAVGSLVSAFVGGISDVDASVTHVEPSGIAIIGKSDAYGTWYFTLNGGTTWSAVGEVAANSALLLANDNDTRIYFAPAANFNGAVSVALTLRAWDQSSGSAGNKVDTTTNGGGTAFSTATDSIAVSVSAVNDAPVAVGDGVYNTAEDTVLNVPAAGVLINDTDVDGNPLTAILVTNATNGTTYNYYVVAYNLNSAPSVQSTTVTATPTAVAPAAPVGPVGPTMEVILVQ